jgi:hypothetical protein
MPELDPNSSPLSRIELLRLAQGLGVVDADVMTRAELRAAIDKAQRPERVALDQHPVTWVSVARRLLASVVERGLNLPDAAALIRGDAKLMAPPMAPPPVATVTLARIYAAQGHLDRAIGTLDEVLDSDPDHELARDLRTQLDRRRAELARREATSLAARAPREEEADAAHASNGHAGTVVSEPARADDPGVAPGPLVASVDAAAELVAPSFDTVERQAAHADVSPFPTEPPTLAGVVPLEVDTPVASDAAESEPPATLAAGVDWQIENDSAASADVVREDAVVTLWAAASPELADAAPATGAMDAVSDASDDVADAHAASSEELAACSADSAEVSTTVAPAAAADTASSASAEPARAAAPPGVEPPASGALGLNGVANGAAAISAPLPESPAAAPEPLPRVPGLLLIETDTAIRYIYWELAAVGSPHWIHVVTHTPTGRGDTERRERRFPVHRQLGVLRLEGVPRQAIVRAKLTLAPDDVRPLVVAGAVRPRSLADDASFEVRYAPHGHATPEALAGRAKPLLGRANPVYWDS